MKTVDIYLGQDTAAHARFDLLVGDNDSRDAILKLIKSESRGKTEAGAVDFIPDNEFSGLRIIEAKIRETGEVIANDEPLEPIYFDLGQAAENFLKGFITYQAFVGEAVRQGILASVDDAPALGSGLSEPKQNAVIDPRLRPKVPAWIQADSGEPVAFDARPWLSSASPEEIQRVRESDHWNTAGVVAHYSSSFAQEVRDIINDVQRLRDSGDARAEHASWSCRVDAAKAEEWLRAHRPDCAE